MIWNECVKPMVGEAEMFRGGLIELENLILLQYIAFGNGDC